MTARVTIALRYQRRPTDLGWRATVKAYEGRHCVAQTTTRPCRSRHVAILLAASIELWPDDWRLEREPARS